MPVQMRSTIIAGSERRRGHCRKRAVRGDRYRQRFGLVAEHGRPVEVCHGQRFNPETLAVRWRGKSIGDVIAEADWVIDLGPEGGVKGGAVVAACTPEALVANVKSHTGVALRPVLARR